MYELIEQLNRDGVTIIMISHDLSAATRYATHILHLGGAEVFFGTRSQYANSALGRRFDVAEGGAGA
jgi:zinc transport system ATP-binding protein